MRRLVEIVWMAIAAISLVEGYIAFQSNGFSKEVQIFAFVFLVSVFMYFLRKRQRTQLQKRKAELDQESDSKANR